MVTLWGRGRSSNVLKIIPSRHHRPPVRHFKDGGKIRSQVGGGIGQRDGPFWGQCWVARAGGNGICPGKIDSARSRMDGRFGRGGYGDIAGLPGAI